MLYLSAEPHNSTSIHQALPDKLVIKRLSPCILYILLPYRQQHAENGLDRVAIDLPSSHSSSKQGRTKPRTPIIVREKIAGKVTLKGL